jgi:hypothetical protein
VRRARREPWHVAPVATDDYFDSMTRDEFLAWFDGSEVFSPDAPLCVRVGVRLPVDLVFKLDVFAEVEGSTRAELIREAVAGLIADRAGVVIPEPRADAA